MEDDIMSPYERRVRISALIVVIVAIFIGGLYAFLHPLPSPQSPEQSYETLLNVSHQACQTQGINIGNKANAEFEENVSPKLYDQFARAAQRYNAALSSAGLFYDHPVHVDVRTIDTTDWCTVTGQIASLPRAEQE